MYLVLEAEGEKASLVARVQAPLKVITGGARLKETWLPAGADCKDVPTGVLSGERSRY